jgi:type IX secretion system PorP/SprF family membrane protein
MIQKSLEIKIVLLLGLMLISLETAYSQQDPQYTQYMYNTMSVNPAYAGQRETLSLTGLYRSQWVGIDGAPETLTFGVHTPLRNERVGLGLSMVNDRLGPVNEFNVNVNFAYTIPVNDYDTKLSFGVKGGIHLLTSDWSKGVQQQVGDPTFADDLSLFSPTIGAGLYLHTRKWYLGVSIPNFIDTEHFDDAQVSIAKERMNYYFIAGYVFDLNDNLKFKPSTFVKAVSGSPIIADISANFLFSEKFTLGAAWRWDDSLSALAGFQISESLYVGYAYDATITDLNNYNSGSHEIMLRFELQKIGRMLSPRFF